MRKFEGKTVLVTGGRQGIGRAIVERFVAEGASVMTCGRGAKPDNFPETILWHSADVSKNADVSAIIEDIKQKFGTLSVLVNNAGIQIEKNIVDTSDQDWEQLSGVNMKGVFMLCRGCIPLMSSGASIINIGSISASISDPGMALYNASKAFVQGLTRSIAVDHGPEIRCNAISPGWIMTGMADAAFAVANDPDAAKKDALARHPVGRFGRPEDIANLAIWIASDEASFATGQCYTLDGGMTAASPLSPRLF